MDEIEITKTTILKIGDKIVCVFPKVGGSIKDILDYKLDILICPRNLDGEKKFALYKQVNSDKGQIIHLWNKEDK